jgi:hypothetical protein
VEEGLGNAVSHGDSVFGGRHTVLSAVLFGFYYLWARNVEQGRCHD